MNGAHTQSDVNYEPSITQKTAEALAQLLSQAPLSGTTQQRPIDKTDNFSQAGAFWSALDAGGKERLVKNLAGDLGQVRDATVKARMVGFFYAAHPDYGTPGRRLATSGAEHYLLAAAREGDTELVAGLLKAGTPVEPRDERGFSPLILAAYHGHLDTVRALLAAGADACAGDARGNTALMGAAFKGYADVVTLLDAQPCAVDQTNRLGQTALMFAVLFGRTEAADALRHQGASARVRDASGRSARDWALTQRAHASPVAP